MKFDSSFKPSEGQMRHEVAHLRKREQLGSAIALGSGSLAVVALIIALIGVLSAGYMILGALAAIAIIAGAYAHLCRRADCSLSDRQLDTQFPASKIDFFK